MARQLGADSPSKQTFRFTSSRATTVLLAGDFTQWQAHPIAMKKGKDGVWIATVELQPGKHNYRFIVDGEWADDPDCTVRVPNPYGSENMVRQVG